MWRFVLTTLIFFSFDEVHAQRKDWVYPDNKWGIGVKTGSPTGITVKNYLPNYKSFEFIAGRPLFWNYDHEGLFNDRFYDKEYTYHRFSFPISLHLRYLKSKPLDNTREGLSFYYGIGAQGRRITYKYYDHFLQAPGRKPYIGIGPEIVAGLEYKLPYYPLAIFVDANLYVEVVDSPFSFEPQAGIGVRYNFK